jgi:hypothetical protein
VHRWHNRPLPAASERLVNLESALSESVEWQELQRELELVAKALRAFNVYVLDAWGNAWCAAHGFSEMPRDDLVRLVDAGVARGRTPLARGGQLDIATSDKMGHRYLRTYGSCYVLLVRFSAPCDVTAVRASIEPALLRLEALTKPSVASLSRVHAA